MVVPTFIVTTTATATSPSEVEGGADCCLEEDDVSVMTGYGGLYDDTDDETDDGDSDHDDDEDDEDDESLSPTELKLEQVASSTSASSACRWGDSSLHLSLSTPNNNCSTHTHTTTSRSPRSAAQLDLTPTSNKRRSPRKTPPSRVSNYSDRLSCSSRGLSSLPRSTTVPGAGGMSKSSRDIMNYRKFSLSRRDLSLGGGVGGGDSNGSVHTRMTARTTKTNTTTTTSTSTTTSSNHAPQLPQRNESMQSTISRA